MCFCVQWCVALHGLVCLGRSALFSLVLQPTISSCQSQISHIHSYVPHSSARTTNIQSPCLSHWISQARLEFSTALSIHLASRDMKYVLCACMMDLPWYQKAQLLPVLWACMALDGSYQSQRTAHSASLISRHCPEGLLGPLQRRTELSQVLQY